MKRLSIGIAGAGPGGLAAALALKRAGHDVVVFDQFDQPRPLGSGLILQPTGLAVLDWLGLGTRMRALGSQIDRLYGKAGNRVVLDVRYEALGPQRGLAVHRAGLFNVLHDAVLAAGVEIRKNSRIRDLASGSMIMNEGECAGPFDLVVDALGSRSPLIPHASGPDYRRKLGYGALWASLPWPGEPFAPNALEQRYEKASIMTGVLPIGRSCEDAAHQAAFFWSLKSQDFAAWRQRGLKPWKADVEAFWPATADLLSNIASPDQLTMASYDHHTLALPYGNRLVFIGDSAHSTSPQLGQGANMALLDVIALTKALERHTDLTVALPDYAKVRRFHVKLYQALSLVFTPFYQSDSALLPLLRDYLVASTSRVAPMQKLLAAIVSGKLGLHSPHAYSDLP